MDDWHQNFEKCFMFCNDQNMIMERPLTLKPPETVSQLKSCIGGVTFYCDMLPRCLHLLAPLTTQVGKKKLNWTSECQPIFWKDQSNLSQRCKVYRSQSPFLHSIVMQVTNSLVLNGIQIAYYSCKLTPALRNYTVGKKEIWSVVETLKEYKSMRFGWTSCLHRS